MVARNHTVYVAITPTMGSGVFKLRFFFLHLRNVKTVFKIAIQECLCKMWDEPSRVDRRCKGRSLDLLEAHKSITAKDR
jgi:hypothetical protein